MKDNSLRLEVIRSKWRPSLWMVVFGVLMLVVLLPLAGLLLLMGWETATGLTFKLRSATGLLTLALGSMIMAAAIGVIFLRALLRPVQDLIDRTAEIEARSPGAFRPFDQGGTQEVAALADRLFDLAKRLSQRSNYLTLFTTHVSHELKTPLTAIQGAAELLRDGGETMDAARRARFLDNISQDAARLAALSTRLRELARADMADTAGHSDFETVLRKSAQAAGLRLVLEREAAPNIALETAHEIAMSATNAQIVWDQLASNAAQAGATEMRVCVELHDARLGAWVGDDGASLSSADRDKIFDPFFTTRRESGGTGMGLGIAQAMMRSHGGALGLSARKGFKFELYWPV